MHLQLRLSMRLRSRILPAADCVRCGCAVHYVALYQHIDVGHAAVANYPRRGCLRLVDLW